MKDENRDLVWLKRAMFALDLVFFEGMFEADGVKIKWARYRPVKKIENFTYGSYLENVIEISPVLAWYWVPDYVVVHTIYHEMLHHVVGHEHDSSFSFAEKRFPHFTESLIWESRAQEMLVNAKNPFARKKTTSG